MNLTVLVGDMKTGRTGDMLVTHALGSCLGLMAFDPVVRLGGLLHAMLPLSGINPEKASANPAMFVDTGVPLLFKALYEQGAVKGRLVVKAAGCGSPLGQNEVFKIGERNYTVLKKLLWKNNILLEAEDVGGPASRTIHFEVSTGRVFLSSNGTKRPL
ncbi:MAG: chemotaxis protein CheD [Hyphomicrobiales bacterium]